MRGLLRFTQHRADRSVAPIVFSQDAEGCSLDQPTGAYCLAAGAPPFDHILSLANRAEFRQKSFVDPTQWRSTIRIEDVDFEVAERSILPDMWFSDAASWRLLLARHWKYPIHINRGECRASVLWLSIAATVDSLRGMDLLDVTDSQVSNGVLSRGRSAVFPLNRDCRRRAAIEAESGIIWNTTWADTWHQPADAGTRIAKDGCLSLATPV